MKPTDYKDGGRQVRSARKQAQRDKAGAHKGAIWRRRATANKLDHKLENKLPKKEDPVRRRRHKLAEAVRTDVVVNWEFSRLPQLRL
ncbi:MAG: hypothetical protein M3Q36_03165 [bacterium]|nr:hypothetical protein [bacterium]